jgi:hypothetical protein
MGAISLMVVGYVMGDDSSAEDYDTPRRPGQAAPVDSSVESATMKDPAAKAGG